MAISSFISPGVLGLTLAAPALSLVLGSIYTSSSVLFMPLLEPLNARTTLPLFDRLFHRGAAVVVPIALAATAANATSAYFARDQTETYLFSAGSLLSIGTLVFTAVALAGTNNRLMALDEQYKGQTMVSEAVEKEVKVLLRKWARLNYFRGFLGLAGGMVGFMALASVIRSSRFHGKQA